MNQIDLSRTDLNLLVLFDTVFRERHVGRAAARLHLSASAVSHGLGRLRRLLHDPLFLRHAKGVVPTERATMLADQVADILAQTRRLLAAAEPFDPSRSDRRFVIGSTDGIVSLVLPALFAEIRRRAPGIDLRVRHIMPTEAPAALDLRQVDIAVVPPLIEIPARFAVHDLYDDDFVIAMRAGHPLGPAPDLEAYCAALHLVLSPTGDAHGFVDTMLEKQGLRRRVALTVPNFMLGLAVVAETDLVAAMPRGQVAIHAARFDVATAPLPMPLGRFAVRAVTPRAAATDAGLAWLLGLLQSAWRQA